MFVFEIIQGVVNRFNHQMSRQNVPDPDVTLEEGVLPVINSRSWGNILLVMASSGGVSYHGGISRLLIVVRGGGDIDTGL